MKMINEKELMELAKSASKNTYSPYSGFPVGAAIVTESGKIFTGTNIENRSFGLTICAERSAICSAVSAGFTKISAVAVFCPKADYPVSPCGACRQVISEFALPGCKILFEGADGKTIHTTVEEIYPFDALRELKE
jgi:cytidine deaminase